ncbi:MAG: hypothetical protein ABSH20_26885, partial [Tepidisphaeraceae bacterium]
RPWAADTPEQISGEFFTVAPIDMEIRIVKDGELQAVEYVDIKSEVETVTQVLDVIPEGTVVKKGDTLAILDSSQLQLRKEDLDDLVTKARSALQISKEMKEIQDSQNAANKEAADVALELAKIELEQYEKGLYPQLVENCKTALEMAKITLKNRQEDLDQTKELYGKGFVTAADVKKAELDVTTAANDVAKADTALKVLEKYQNAMDTARLRSAVAQAKEKAIHTVRENESLMLQRVVDLQEKEITLRDLLKRTTKLQDQINACTIKAPEDALVIYASTVDREREPLQDGTSVRQSQWLFRLPDVRRMKAVVLLSESLKVRIDEARQHRAIVNIVGVPRSIGATLTKISVLPDNRLRWSNPDRRDYPCDVVLDETPPGLKPGTKVERCEIFVDRIDHALAVPLAAVYSVASDSYVFVRTGDTVKERKVSLGVSNESHVQVLSGIQQGEQVLLLQPGQGRTLLEKAGIKISDATSRPSRFGPGKNTSPKPAPADNKLNPKPAAPPDPDSKSIPARGPGLTKSEPQPTPTPTSPAKKS